MGEKCRKKAYYEKKSKRLVVALLPRLTYFYRPKGKGFYTWPRHFRSVHATPYYLLFHIPPPYKNAHLFQNIYFQRRELPKSGANRYHRSKIKGFCTWTRRFGIFRYLLPPWCAHYRILGPGWKIVKSGHSRHGPRTLRRD